MTRHDVPFCLTVVTSIVWPLLSFPHAVEAQFRGQVKDGVSGLPLHGGFVVLVDQHNREVAETLTGIDGWFEIPLPDSDTGRFRLQARRIGYRPFVGAWFEWPTDELSFVLHIQPLAIELETLEFRESSKCNMKPNADSVTSTLIEQTWEALASSVRTGVRARYEVLSQVNTVHTNRAGRTSGLSQLSSEFLGTLFSTSDPVTLSQAGYVVVDDTSVVYHAPDPIVLQSAAFLETHCFHVVSPLADRPNLIGLAFEPVQDRPLPDIAGILWIDIASWHLSFLEYTYRNLPSSLRTSNESDDGSGRIEFATLPTGDWIVSRWQIQVPVSYREERVNSFGRELQRRAVQFRITEGEVLAVADSSGESLYLTELSEVTGRVLRRGSGRLVPIPGARVGVSGTWFATVTDSSGTYKLSVPIEGDYALTVIDPVSRDLVFLDEIPIARFARRETTTLDVLIPSLSIALANRCPDQSPNSQYAIYGFVTDANNRPFPRATVVSVWSRPNRSGDYFASVQSHVDGSYVFCDTPTAGATTVYGWAGERRSDVRRVVIPSEGAQVPSAAVGEQRQDMSLTYAVPVVAGAVTDLASGEPIHGAIVAIRESGSSDTTDATGAFQLQPSGQGIRTLTIRRPGYLTKTGAIAVDSSTVMILQDSSVGLSAIPQVIGVVYDGNDSAALQQVTVTLMTPDGRPISRARTDGGGKFSLSAIVDGQYWLVSRMVGYAPDTTGPITLRRAQAEELRVHLQPIAVMLDPVTVTADGVSAALNKVGFYMRQREGQGVFLDRNDIEKRAGAGDIGHLLQGVLGIRVDHAGAIRLRGAPSGPAGASCYNRPPLVFLDGIRMETNEPESGMPNAHAWYRTIPLDDIEGLEVYRSPSEVPIQYNVGGEGSCGVMLIWTRRG